MIRGVPEEQKLRYEKLKQIRLEWKEQVERIEVEYKKAQMNAAEQGVAGVGLGVAVASLGPTAAMGIATTFGVASTGTAIASLSGAAATNAALAWLGGGALVAGGGGMAAGNAFLALVGPIGWTIAGVSLLTSGIFFFKTKSDQEKLENIFIRIAHRDMKSYELAMVELNERIQRMKSETKYLKDAIAKIKIFGSDYEAMNEQQQYELGSYVNLMEASTMLLINPILGLQLKFNEQDYDKVHTMLLKEIHKSEYQINHAKDEEKLEEYELQKEYILSIMKYYLVSKKMILTLSNLLYKIQLDEKERKLLGKSLRKNKEFLESINRDKDTFDDVDIMLVEEVLSYCYQYKTY